MESARMAGSYAVRILVKDNVIKKPEVKPPATSDSSNDGTANNNGSVAGSAASSVAKPNDGLFSNPAVLVGIGGAVAAVAVGVMFMLSRKK
jgi:hypothetical protein